MQFSATIAIMISIGFQLIMAVSFVKNIVPVEASFYFRVACGLGMLLYFSLWGGLVWILFSMKDL